MTGPWALARRARDRWGLSPSSNRFPTIGRGAGPGASRGLLLLEEAATLRKYRKGMMNKRKRKRKHDDEDEESSIGIGKS
ncbi:putative geraniol 8-hydroxylase [Iris pallida]|uniref:Geraniol 8-hydroxylase n=1 Tax=Iris pallida TaxID=29817 RepID=A0AAX6EZ67_IRIPA|nr:putative geraniol 8-hydroxylase [Iris pallida]